MASWIESVLRARFLVASLGEAESPPWWRSQATTPAGRRFLERLYPRTCLAASLETAGRAAALEHDGRIGRVGAYHLFRLPLAEEAAVHDLIKRPATAKLIAELARLETREDRLAALSELTGDATDAGGQGPIHRGAVQGLRRSRAIERIAGAYYHGFQAGRPVFPYLADASA